MYPAARESETGPRHYTRIREGEPIVRGRALAEPRAPYIPELIRLGSAALMAPTQEWEDEAKRIYGHILTVRRYANPPMGQVIEFDRGAHAAPSEDGP